MKTSRWMPLVMIGGMMLVMIGVMAIFSWIFGEMNPLTMMLPGNVNIKSGMWGGMLISFLGLLVMFVLMFFLFSWMTGGRALMSLMMRGKATIQNPNDNLTVMTFSVPDVSCAHCKMKIEKEIGNLPGVASVYVNVNAKQAVINLISLPTRAEIESLLGEIGYPPEIQETIDNG